MKMFCYGDTMTKYYKIMNHDIAHCGNDKCKDKDKCYRYLAHLEAKERGLTYVAYFVIDERMLADDYDCKEFWDYDKYINK